MGLDGGRGDERAREDAASAPPGSLVDLARSALPKELRGLLPTSGYFGTATFETPQVARRLSSCEPGLGQFQAAGFPAPDEETRLAMDALGDAARGGVIVDASCGLGCSRDGF